MYVALQNWMQSVSGLGRDREHGWENWKNKKANENHSDLPAWQALTSQTSKIGREKKTKKTRDILPERIKTWDVGGEEQVWRLKRVLNEMEKKQNDIKEMTIIASVSSSVSTTPG